MSATRNSTGALLQGSPNSSARYPNTESTVSTHSHEETPPSTSNRLVKGLAWFSVGLGLAELLAPRFVAKISGVPENHTTLIRLYGLRELATGVAIFSSNDPAAAVWSRVAGDALDLASLGTAFSSSESNRSRLAIASANVLAVTTLDLICASQLSNTNGNQKDFTA